MDDLPVDVMRARRPNVIKNLVPRLPERGRIKIGMKGATITSSKNKEFQPPVKLDHFVVTTLTRGRDGNFEPDEQLMARLGPHCTQLPVRLIYDDPDLNFPTRYGCYVGRALWCSGDGEQATRMTTTPQEMADKARIEPRMVACPCQRSEPGYQGADKCKMNGSLSVLIDGAGGIGGVWRFRTTSYNTIVGLMSSLAFIRSVTGGVLANLPLQLRLTPKQATAPDGTGVLVYVVSLEYPGDLESLQTLAHNIALNRAKMHVSIEHIEVEAKRVLALAAPANALLPGDETDDIVEEFYPEQVGGSGPATGGEPEPPRAGDIRRTAPAGGIVTTGDLIDSAGPAQTAADVRLYSVTDCDGEIKDYDNLSGAAYALSIVVDDAIKRGASHVAAAGENNAALIQEIGEPQKSPAPSPTRSTIGAKPALQTTTPPRSSIWGDPRYLVELHDAHGGPDWKRWANDILFLAGEATDAEYEKLLADNREYLVRFKVANAVMHRDAVAALEQSRRNLLHG